MICCRASVTTEFLLPLVVAAGPEAETWQVVSGHRRLACAMALGLTSVPCEVRTFPSDTSRHLAVLGI